MLRQIVGANKDEWFFGRLLIGPFKLPDFLVPLFSINQIAFNQATETNLQAHKHEDWLFSQGSMFRSVKSKPTLDF